MFYVDDLPARRLDEFVNFLLRRGSILNGLVSPVFALLGSSSSSGTSLTCYECQEKKAGDYCSQPKKQQCNGATSICLKYLHKEGKPGKCGHSKN